VWLGTGLCLCVAFTPPIPGPEYTTGRVLSSSAAAAVEPIFHIDSWPWLGVCVYGASPSLHDDDDDDDNNRRAISIEDDPPSCSGSIVAGVDALFHMLALTRRGYEDDFLYLNRDENFLGRFPVSRRGLQALVKDAARSESAHWTRHRTLHLIGLGIAADQWDCLLRGCDGPGVNFPFYSAGYGERPDAIRALIRALRDNECRARITLHDVHSLPESVLCDLAAALEQNSSLTELEFAISCTDRTSGFSDPAAAIPAGDTLACTIFASLVRRNAPIDVLELHVPAFSSLLRTRLWDDVVPAAVLNLRTLVLRTGSGLDPRAPRRLAVCADEEHRMIRAVSASTSLCTFDFRDWSIPDNNSQYLDRIDKAVRPFLRFNRFRRLVAIIAPLPSVALQKRWFATLLLRSVARREMAWCYFLLTRNVGAFQECVERGHGLRNRSEQ
jgi:hypothetical protein